MAPKQKFDRDAAILQTVYHLLSGQRKEHISEWITKTYPESDHTDILAGAEAYFAEISHFSTDAKKGFCIEAAQHLYAQLVSSGDYKGALNALQEIAKLAGVYPTRAAKDRKPDQAAKGKPSTGQWPPQWIKNTA